MYVLKMLKSATNTLEMKKQISIVKFVILYIIHKQCSSLKRYNMRVL